MLLGFKRQFAEYVEEGTKFHTVRSFRKIPPRVGETAHCYVDPRQKTMRLLGRWPVVRVVSITLDFEKSGIGYALRITIDNQTLSRDEAERFAWCDGFRGQNRPLFEMATFWIKSKRLTDALDSKPWHGQVIYWDPKKPLSS